MAKSQLAKLTFIGPLDIISLDGRNQCVDLFGFWVEMLLGSNLDLADF